MDELKKYCLDDVRITKQIYEYGIEHGKVMFFSNRDFSVHEIAVNWGRMAASGRSNRRVFSDQSFLSVKR